MSVAQIIYELLGGNQFAIMTGSTRFVGHEKALSFCIGCGAKAGVNYIRVTRTNINEYSIEFYKHRGPDKILIISMNGVAALKMQEVFTEVTGFECKL